MNSLNLNKLKTNAINLNVIGKKVASVSNPDEIPRNYELLTDPNGFTLMDADGKIIVVPIEGNGEEGGSSDAPGESAIITFTVNDEEYTAEKGMTWVDFCKSQYNRYDWTCEGPTDNVWTWRDYVDDWNYEYWMLTYNGKLVTGGETVIPNGAYEELEDSMHLG